MIKTELLPVNGFLYSAIHSGIKRMKKDLSLIVCPDGAVAAGTFTTNKTKAAPVVFSEKNIQNPFVKAVVINSGNANACTGKQGVQDVNTTAQLAAELVGAEAGEILISSTGVIGVNLPMNAITNGLPKAYHKLSAHGLDEVAFGILTTDTMVKQFSTQVTLSDGSIATLSGIAKGSGMIHPNMATMLGFVMTDINIEKTLLTQMTKAVVAETFNMVTVDGDTSTNDMFLVLSSCKLGNALIGSETEDYEAFKKGLTEIAKALSISIAKDGEGASKLLTVKLSGAPTLQDARKLAKSVVSSSLVKAAFFGKDANWGRIICALGYADAEFNPDLVTLKLASSGGCIELMHKGAPVVFDEAFALEVLDPDMIDIIIELDQGDFSAEAWGCDLTYDYVKINGAYRT